jgi:hypothetical protein
MPQKPVDPKKARDARARKVLLVLVPVLIAIIAWQGPKVLKQVRGEGSNAAAAQPAATPLPATPGTTEAPATTPPPGDEAAVVVSVNASLADTDTPAPADEGQLITFGRFEATDPFVQLVSAGDEEAAATEDGASTTPSTTTPSTTTPTTPPPATGGTPTGPPSVSNGGSTATEVSISVNGKVLVLGVGDTFPESDPAFEVVSIGADSAEIGLVSGAFSGGVETVTLEIGEPVTLISQPDGARFTLKLVDAD